MYGMAKLIPGFTDSPDNVKQYSTANQLQWWRRWWLSIP